MSNDFASSPTGTPATSGPAYPQPSGVDSAAPTGGPGASKKRGGPLLSLIVLGRVVAGIYGASWYFNRDHIDKANVGDCVKVLADDAEDPYRIVDCADSSASLKVLKRITDSGEKCKEVAGASRSFYSDGVDVCMGAKGVDPAKAVNVAKEGDCLAITGNDAEKADCASPQATYKVLKRLTNASTLSISGPCADVPGATSSYSWTWESTGPRAIKIPSLSADVLLCLGPK